MGRFVKDALDAAGVDTSHIKTDPQRLTGLVLLAIQNRDHFPLIFYREHCADMALSADDIDAGLLQDARTLLLTGTHLSTKTVFGASKHAIELALKARTRIVLDIDYRPVLWGVGRHNQGDARDLPSDHVTQEMQKVLQYCDLIVGTEEEVHIAGGSTDTLQALSTLRTQSRATIVLKRGPLGCVVFEDTIPDKLEDALVSQGFPVPILNVLGAGDAFMSGFLRGWINGEPLSECARYANAMGAIVVSRHGCAPAMPSKEELDDYLSRQPQIANITDDKRLKRLHRQTLHQSQKKELYVLAFDHRPQLGAAAEARGAPKTALIQLKRHIMRGALKAIADEGSPHPGVIIDDTYGQEALFEAARSDIWIARPIEQPECDSLTFEGGPNVELTLGSWPQSHVVKCLVNLHPAKDPAHTDATKKELYRLYEACQTLDRTLLIEIIPQANGGDVDPSVLPETLNELYGMGIYPDWWKLPPPTGCWAEVNQIVEHHDPHCQGVLLLGLDAPEQTLQEAFREAAHAPVFRGFAVGRTIFFAAALAWLSGDIDDRTLETTIAEGYTRVVDLWQRRSSS